MIATVTALRAIRFSRSWHIDAAWGWVARVGFLRQKAEEIEKHGRSDSRNRGGRHFGCPPFAV